MHHHSKNKCSPQLNYQQPQDHAIISHVAGTKQRMGDTIFDDISSQ